MTDSYAQEPAEMYGDQLAIDSRIAYDFAPIPKRLFAVQPIVGNDVVLLYCLLTNYVNFGRGDRTVWPTQQLLREITGFGRNRMIRTVKALRDYGMIETTQMKKGREFGANRYVLTRINEWKIPRTDSGVPDLSTPTDGPPSEGHRIRSNVLTRSNSSIRNNAHKNARASQEDFPQSAAGKNRRLKPLDIVDDREIYCHAGRDGDCSWSDCPQNRDGEPQRSGRHCPLETEAEEEQPGGHGGEEEPGTEKQLFSSTRGRDWSGAEELDRAWGASPATMDTLQPVAPPPAMCGGGGPAEVCSGYISGFPCELMQNAMAFAVLQWWPQYDVTKVGRLIGELRESRAAVHAVAHEYALEDISQAAAYWKTTNQPLRPSLFFSQFASTLANAQAEQTPAHDPTDLSRYDKPRTYNTARPVPLEDRTPPSAEDVAAAKKLVGDLTQKLNASQVLEAKRKQAAQRGVNGCGG